MISCNALDILPTSALDHATVLVDRRVALPRKFAELAATPTLLATLHEQSPEAYLATAAHVRQWLHQATLSHRAISWRDYSMRKLVNAMKRNGFGIECGQDVDSTILTDNDASISHFDVNSASSILGLLTLDRDVTVPVSQFQQSSRFVCFIGLEPRLSAT